MKKKKSAFFARLSSVLTGDAELEKADRQLKNLSFESDDDTRREIRKIRGILRGYRKRLKGRILAVWAILIVFLACVVLTLVQCAMSLGHEISMQAQERRRLESERAAQESERAAQESERERLAAETQARETGGTEQAAAAETETEGEPVELLMSFTGDCILGTDENFAWDTSLNAYYATRGASYFFENVRDIFEQDDLTVINMEGTLTEETAREDKQFAFKGDPEFVDILTTSSVEAANVANNHSFDYGEQSFRDTVQILEEHNIRTFGYDETAILNVKGVNVGLLGIYELDDHLERREQLINNIQKLKDEGADIIVAVFHWGNELMETPDENQLILGHLAIDEGADLVIGHHPHILQGIEEYKGKMIAYSLGNFCFGGNTYPKETDTMIFQMKFNLDGKHEIVDSEMNLIPCSVSSDPYINNYQPTVLEGDEAARVLDVIQQRSDAIAAW